MSLFAELQRRSVFKVGAAYLVVAWLAAQAAGLAFPVFEAPAWALRVFIFVLMLGFPLALVVAWAVDLTPEGVKVEHATTGNTRFYAAVVALLVLATAWFFYGQASYKRDDPQAQSGSPSVAVLPFANLSGDPAQEFFSDGMTEEILNVLVKVPDLKVAARTSVFAFKGQGGDIREIGKKLGVTHVVEGSVRRDATKVRITAQLIRVADGFHVWSETYDRELKSVFEVQDDIAKRIAGQLKGSLAPAEAPAARAGIDPAAYEDYLIARKLYRNRSDVLQAVGRLQRTVARAPSFAPGWASLSLAIEVAPYFSNRLQLQGLGPLLPMMREAAERARALAPEDAMTLHALGNVARGEGRFADAEDLYRRSIAVDPTYPDVREDLSELLVCMRRAEDGLAEARALVALEPYAWIFWNRISAVGIALRRADLIDESQAKIDELNPTRSFGSLARFNLAIEQGDRAAEERAIAQAVASASWINLESLALWRWAQRDPAIDDAVARRAVLEDSSNAAYAALRGERDLFFASLAQPFTPHARYQTFSNLDEAPDQSLMADPRAKRLLREYGFEAYWRARGWPARCKPLGDADFACR
jgi:TolB-like protein